MNSTEIIVFNFILNQREALYQLHNQKGITKVDLEILAFSKLKTFFSLYDLQSHYSHTNVQQLIRGIKRLKRSGYIQTFTNGIKGKPSIYVICNAGKDIIRTYIKYTLMNNDSMKDMLSTKQKPITSFIRHPLYDKIC